MTRYRRDEYDDDEDEIKSPRGALKRAAKPPRGGLPPGGWVLVAAVGLGGMIAGGVLTYALTVGRPGQVKPPEVVGTVPPDTAPARKLWTRDEFKAAVQGKSQADVISAVGRPDSTRDGEWGAQFWLYDGLTINPVTNKPDPSTRVEWRNGQIWQVVYLP